MCSFETTWAAADGHLCMALAWRAFPDILLSHGDLTNCNLGDRPKGEPQLRFGGDVTKSLRVAKCVPCHDVAVLLTGGVKDGTSTVRQGMS